MKIETLIKKSLWIAAFLALTAFVGCSVEKEEEGELPDVDVEGDAGELPDYDIVKKEEGEMPSMDVDVEGGNLPEYDVDMADVDVGTTTETMKVPKVKIVVEEEEFEVPYIDVDMPGDDSDGKKTRQPIMAAVNTPNPGYQLKIQQVYLGDDDLVVVSKLTENDVQEADGEGVAKDGIVVNAAEVDGIRHYVISPIGEIEGREGDYTVVRSRNEIEESFEDYEIIYEVN